MCRVFREEYCKKQESGQETWLRTSKIKERRTVCVLKVRGQQEMVPNSQQGNCVTQATHEERVGMTKGKTCIGILTRGRELTSFL